MNKSFRNSVIIGAVCQILHTGADILCGYLTSLLLARALGMDPYGVARFAVMLGAVLILRIPVKYSMTKRWTRHKLLDLQSFRKKIYAGILDRTIDLTGEADLDVKLDKDIQAVSDYHQSALPQGIGSALALVCVSALLFRVNWQVGLPLFFLNFLQLLPTIVYEGWAKKVYARTRTDEEAYCGWILEGSRGLDTLKSYGQEPWFLKRFSLLNQQIFRAGQKAEWTGTVENIVGAAVNTLLCYGSYLLLGLFVLLNVMPVSQAPVAIVLMQYLYGSMEGLLQWRLHSFSCKQADLRLAPREWAEPRISPTESALLSARGVKKSYQGKCVLDNISFRLLPGEKVLLCGENGSGKSTLIRLLLNSEPPDQGEITYAPAICQKGTELSISCAMQEEVSLPISGNELIAALQEAGSVDTAKLRGYLNELYCTAEQLNAPLSELSMGQRKKIYLAVALAKPAALLVLDEPFNHLDADSIDALTRILIHWPQAMLLCNHAPMPQAFWDRAITIERGCLV